MKFIEQQSVKTAVYHITMSVLSVKYDIVFVMPINGAIRIKYHRSIQRKKLYLRMSSVLLSTSILAIYDLWKSSEIVLTIVDKSLAVRLSLYLYCLIYLFSFAN
jgi:hypothetical protein